MIAWQREFNANKPELMDIPQPVTEELRNDLANLQKLNRWFGSYALIRFFLERWLRPGKQWTVLDLATASGDIPREIVRWSRSRQVSVTIDAVDFQASTLAIAREQSTAFPEIHYHQSDIRSFPTDRQWDLVLCSLALHHFSEADAQAILQKCQTLSRNHVVIADLRRCFWGQVGVYALTALLMREPMTRHDARLSVRRAFSESELLHLARKGGWPTVAHRRFFCSRQAIWIENTPATPQ